MCLRLLYVPQINFFLILSNASCITLNLCAHSFLLFPGTPLAMLAHRSFFSMVFGNFFSPSCNKLSCSTVQLSAMVLLSKLSFTGVLVLPGKLRNVADDGQVGVIQVAWSPAALLLLSVGVSVTTLWRVWFYWVIHSSFIWGSRELSCC